MGRGFDSVTCAAHSKRNFAKSRGVIVDATMVSPRGLWCCLSQSRSSCSSSSTHMCKSLGSIYGPCSIQQACTVFFTPVSHRSFPWRKVSNAQHVLSVWKEHGLLANLVFVVVRAAKSEGFEWLPGKMQMWSTSAPGLRLQHQQPQPVVQNQKRKY